MNPNVRLEQFKVLVADILRARLEELTRAANAERSIGENGKRSPGMTGWRKETHESHG